MYCRAKVSLLLWEKVAAVRLTDEELVLRLVTPHPPLTRSPFPHWGRLFVRHESPSAFPDKHCFCGHKSELRILLSYSLFNLAQVKRFIFVQFFLVVFLCKIINHFAHSFIIITEFYVVVCVKINMLGFFNQII